jgi:predicted Rossmann fold flavoprotein
MSYPHIGASRFGHKMAERFGLAVTPCRPGLVPLMWNQNDRETLSDLTGISIQAIVGNGRYEFTEEVLFTHLGLSGPAVLQISSYWEPGTPISVDLIPEADMFPELSDGRERKAELVTVLSRHMPRRLAETFARVVHKTKPLAQCSDADLRAIEAAVHDWAITPGTTAGYAKAEVTVGGVDTAEISSKTMESKKVPGLYFIGEVLDVTGQLGGYNLHWAWASGFAAGQVV